MDDAASNNCVLSKVIRTHTAFFDKMTDLINLSLKNC